jgi:predicted metal-dependent HD superfamily phosphohydrolase
MMRREPDSLHESRWAGLMQRLCLPQNLDTFERLQAAYAEKHRHYHTSEHINHCLVEVDRARTLAREPDEVELALWFHDAIYVTRSNENEAKSAEWAVEFLESNGVDSKRVERVRDLIMATTHDANPRDADAMLLVDIDLSILGADPQTYLRFEKNVRKEYSWVPAILFRRTRAGILQSFLDRPSVYATPSFCDRLEVAARANLRSAIAELTGGR